MLILCGGCFDLALQAEHWLRVCFAASSSCSLGSWPWCCQCWGHSSGENVLLFCWQIFDFKFEIAWHRSQELLRFLFLSLLKRQGLGGALGMRGWHKNWSLGRHFWHCSAFFVMLLFKKMNWRKLSHNWWGGGGKVERKYKKYQSVHSSCAAQARGCASATGSCLLQGCSPSLPCYRQGMWWSSRDL